MANGDAAAAAGLDTLNPSTADLRDGASEINKSRDYLAGHVTDGTHDASAIVSGIFDPARIPAITIDKVPAIPVSHVAGAWNSDINTPWQIKTTAGVTATGIPTLGTSYRALYFQTSTGQLCVVASTRDAKNSLGEYVADLDAFRALRARRFAYIDDEGQSPRIGAFVEEVNECFPELAVHDDGAPVALHDEQVPWMLVSVVQQLLDRVVQLEQRLDGSAE